MSMSKKMMIDSMKTAGVSARCVEELTSLSIEQVRDTYADFCRTMRD